MTRFAKVEAYIVGERLFESADVATRVYVRTVLKERLRPLTIKLDKYEADDVLDFIADHSEYLRRLLNEPIEIPPL